MSQPGGTWAVKDGPPWAVAVLALLLGAVLVTARWVVAADGDVARFVVAGSLLTSPEAGIPVLEGPGYDGQFSYRLAVDPTDLRPEAQGVTLDSTLRLQRITYPVLAHLVALGQPERVPAALVLVNLLALAVVALLAALLAREAGGRRCAGCWSRASSASSRPWPATSPSSRPPRCCSRGSWPGSGTAPGRRPSPSARRC